MNNSYYPRYPNSRRPPYHQMPNVKQIDASATNKNSPFLGANQSSSNKGQHFELNQATSKKEQHTEFNQVTSKKEPHTEFKQPLLRFMNLDINEPILEFHGIQIYQDDLLILMLLFFLYKENVNDGLLYIALLALLVM